MSIQKKEYKSKKTGKNVRKYYACVYDTRTEKHVWSKSYPTEREAKKEEARIIQEQEKRSITVKKIQFSEAAEEFLASSKAEYAKSTYGTYLAYYKRYIAPIFGDREIHTITPRHVQLFFNEICETYSPATVNKIKNILSRNFRKMVDRNNKEFEPLPRIRLYDLRHSLATNLIMDDTIPDKVVSEIMGTSIKTLFYHYSHVRNGIQGTTLSDYASGIL